MHASQVVLLLLIVAFASYIVRLRSTTRDRVIYLGLAAIGALLVLRPEATNQAAKLLSIGRGADLVFYFFIIFCLFHFATTASTLRRLRHDLGTLVRAQAIANSRPAPASEDVPITDAS